MECNNKKLIVVLGMHRSGTSAITRSLKVMGVDLGNNMMPPHEEINAKGFWEDLDFVHLNETILHFLGTKWHHLAPIENVQIDRLVDAGYLNEAIALLNLKTQHTPAFGFKDPRVAKLLPFWEKAFAQCQLEIGYVLALRNPISVAESLAKRDEFSIEKSYWLWLGHVLTCLSSHISAKRIVLDFDRLMQSPDTELCRLATTFGLEINPVDFQHYQTEFLDERLRHTVHYAEELARDENCPPLVQEVYTTLLGVASGETDPEELTFKSHLARWIREFQRLRSVLRLADHLDRQAAQLNQAMNGKDEEIARLTQAMNGKDEEITRLTQALSERDEQATFVNEMLNVRNRQVTYLKQAVNERDWRITGLIEALNTRGECTKS